MADEARKDATGLPGLLVAIDGPAGSGKTSVAAAVAQRLGLVHVDTGAMYRALTVAALDGGVDPADGPALASLLARLDLRCSGGRLLVDGREAGASLRRPDVEARVSEVSAHPEVRPVMVRRQRRLAWSAPDGAVMEGRDIGSVVLPLAPCKIYLDARPEVRAQRRARQEGHDGDPAAVARVERDLQRRDAQDRGRDVSPLLVSPDAHVIDSSDLGLEEVVDRCVSLARASVFRPSPPSVMAAFRFHTLRFRLVHAFLEVLWFGVFGLKVYGRQYGEVARGLLFASNHIAFFDPPVVGTAVPRELHFLAKSELFRGPLGRLITFYNSIPIVRGRFDAKAFARANALIASGRSLIVFPEGTRRPVGRPGPMKRGLGLLAQRTGAPYVPCYVRGTHRMVAALLRREPLEVWMGPPVVLHALPTLARQMDDAAIQTRVGELFLQQVRALAERSRLHHGEEAAGSSGD